MREALRNALWPSLLTFIFGAPGAIPLILSGKRKSDGKVILDKGETAEL
jgi:hypothetical protein